MEQKRSKEHGQRGSITIEASISLTFFLFAMICILFAIRTSRVQTAIQYSLDMAAQDISQYTYLYYASGVYDLEQEIKTAGESASETMNKGVEHLDQMAVGVETALSTVKDGGKTLTQLGDEDYSANLESLKTKWSTLKQDGAVVQEQAGKIKDAVKAMKDDASAIKESPVAFAKSLAAFATGEGMDMLKGPLLGMLYGRAMCEKYIGNGADADQWLKRMNVVDGMEGLNFAWSSVLDGTSQDVNLVVTYKVKVFPGVLDGIEATFAQSASTRAWMGGDERVKKTVSKTDDAAATPAPSPSGEGVPDSNEGEAES